MAGRTSIKHAATGPEVDGVFRNRNAYGEALRLPGQRHGCKANESDF